MESTAIRIIKSIDPKIITIVGGAHPSGVAEESLKHFKEADFAFKGESEVGSPHLLDKLSGKNNVDMAEMPGLIWRKSGEVYVNPAIFVLSVEIRP